MDLTKQERDVLEAALSEYENETVEYRWEIINHIDNIRSKLGLSLPSREDWAQRKEAKRRSDSLIDGILDILAGAMRDAFIERVGYKCKDCGSEDPRAHMVRCSFWNS